ncbi:MAG: hypothetical protein COB20_14600 [SAR86 cluster bacterium]|uniref:Uncharacterized protein n=1 Tax=SAR86 cluster bacterium TaxID=2030880 RepID=A0A2A4WWD6_9GAMM|nr:MAG: hypothetical protein COB20_14600 [SAR86 cluster bacterium]
MQEDHSVLSETNHSAHGPECNDPQMGCCMIEMSVGINDPPSDNDSSIASHSKPAPHKLQEQQDSDHPVLAYYDLAESFDSRRVVFLVESLEPFLPYAPPPLYKSTERYRI